MVYNVYNTQVDNATRSVSPVSAFPFSPHPTLVLEDFNIHQFASQPGRALKTSDLALSSPYFATTSDKGYALLNTPGSITRYSPMPSQRDGVIDLAFQNLALVPYVRDWCNSLPSTGSDHTAIRITLASPTCKVPALSARWAETPRDLLTPFLQSFTCSPISPARGPPDMPPWFDHNLSGITGPIITATPRNKPSTWAKAWWSRDISALRSIFHAVSRRLRAGEATAGEAKQAKYAYFGAIKKAKNTHWNLFTANADRNQLWAAARLKKPRDRDRFPSFPNSTTPAELNTALIDHVFPPRPQAPTATPRHHPNAPPITPGEFSRALSKSSDKSTPGPDQIPYGFWKRLHAINPALLPALLTPLVESGVHAKSLKAANGIVLPKPSKATYTDPASFRIIVLLETVSKILEWTMTFGRYDHAMASGLINPNQFGSLPGLLVDDAELALTHDIRTLQACKRKVSTFFLDIKSCNG